MRKSTIIFSVISVLLVAVIGIGAWMANSRQAPKPLQGASEQAQLFTMNDVSRHNSKDDCWTVISDNVYDLTGYVNRHPGGDEILQACGTDASTLFNSRQDVGGQSIGSGTPHSEVAREQLARLRVGRLLGS